MDAIEDDGDVVSLSSKRAGQKVFREIVAQSLTDLEYEGDYVARWRPKRHEAVVIDPSRHFGDPILDHYGVSTKTLSDEFRNFGSLEYLAAIYEIPKPALRAGLLFEAQLDEAHGQRSF
jgi:uncharacterized protein (DUF433 family)